MNKENLLKMADYIETIPQKKFDMEILAVQTLIDYMEANFHLTNETRIEFKRAIENEQQQIMDAFDIGAENGYYGKTNFSCAEQYYSQTYNVKTN